MVRSSVRPWLVRPLQSVSLLFCCSDLPHEEKTVLHQSHDLQFQKSDPLFVSEEHFKSFFLSYVNPIKRPSPLSSLSLNFFAMQIFRPKQKKRGEKRRFFLKKPSWKEKRSNIAAGWPQQRTYGLFFLFFAPRYDPLTCQKKFALSICSGARN